MTAGSMLAWFFGKGSEKASIVGGRKPVRNDRIQFAPSPFPLSFPHHGTPRRHSANPRRLPRHRPPHDENPPSRPPPRRQRNPGRLLPHPPPHHRRTRIPQKTHRQTRTLRRQLYPLIPPRPNRLTPSNPQKQTAAPDLLQGRCSPPDLSGNILHSQRSPKQIPTARAVCTTSLSGSTNRGFSTASSIGTLSTW